MGKFTTITAVLLFAASTSARSLRGRMLVTYDNCYIHRGCVGGASYSFGTDKDGRPDSMGAGWYCNDGQYVDGSTQYDQCQRLRLLPRYVGSVQAGRHDEVPHRQDE